MILLTISAIIIALAALFLNEYAQHLSNKDMLPRWKAIVILALIGFLFLGFVQVTTDILYLFWEYINAN